MHSASFQHFWRHQFRTYPDRQPARHVEEHSDPLPGDALLENLLRHLLETFPPGAATQRHAVYCAVNRGNRAEGRSEVKRLHRGPRSHRQTHSWNSLSSLTLSPMMRIILPSWVTILRSCTVVTPSGVRGGTSAGAASRSSSCMTLRNRAEFRLACV